jgi:hypothetical protein
MFNHTAPSRSVLAALSVKRPAAPISPRTTLIVALVLSLGLSAALWLVVTSLVPA